MEGILLEISLHLFLKGKITLSYDKTCYRIRFDITKEEFLSKVEFLYHHLLYPLYLHRKKITLLSFPFSDGIKIDSSYLHTNLEALWMHLYLEAWVALVQEPILPKIKKRTDPSLNLEQRKAVRRTFGPVCLLAPAGSGKTKTLISRVFYLLDGGVKEEQILILVFNKKAEEELKERLQNPSLEVRTFHSFCYQILKEYTNYELYTEDASFFARSLLEEVVMEEKVVFQKEKNWMEPYIEKLSKVENELIPLTEMELEVEGKRHSFYPVFTAYLSLLKREEMVCFDDLIYLALCLILENGTIRRRLQKKYQYLLVDEFQDLNPAQLLFVRILALPQNHLFVVGDDDQMIYGFRGAKVDAILNFCKMYPRGYQLSLKWNYRSGKRIVLHAKEFIDHNFIRYTKDFTSYQEKLGEVSIFLARNFKEEAEAVVRWIEQIEGEVVIIYRYREYGLFLQLFLSVLGYGMEESLSFQREFSFLFTLLFCLLEPFEEKMARRLYAELHRKYPSSVKNTVSLFKDLGNRYYEVYEYLQKQDLSFQKFCFLLRVKEDFFLPNHMQNESYAESFLENFIDYFGGVKGLFAFLKQKKKKKKRRNLLFSTIHQIKGREYSSVCYFHMERPRDKNTMEEERRISYVAMTRARENFMMTASSYQAAYIKEYSCFSRFRDFSNQELEKKITELKEKEKDVRLRISLLERDQNYLKDHFEYEVREEGLHYFCKQVNQLEDFQEEYKKIKQELFYYEEEKEARRIVFRKN